MPYAALSPICTADKVGLIICRGCYWGGLVWGNDILARLVNSVSLRFFHPPSFSIVSPVFLLTKLLILSSPSPAFFHCCLSICCFSLCLSLWAVGCAHISSLPHLTSRLPSPFCHATRHTCELNSDVALRVSLLMRGLLQAVYTRQRSTRRMFYTQLNSTLNWLTDRALLMKTSKL